MSHNTYRSGMLLLLVKTMTSLVINFGVYFELVEDMVWQSHVHTISSLKLRRKLYISHIIA